MWGCTLPWCIYNLCSLKLQSVQRIILDRWLRKALPILYILSLQIDVQSCLFAKLFFFPLIISWGLQVCILQDGLWRFQQIRKRELGSTTRETLQPTPRQSWTLPSLWDLCGISQAGKLPSEVAHWELSPASHRIILVLAAAFWFNYSFHSFVWVPFFSRVDQLLQLRFPFHITAFTVSSEERDASNSQKLTLDRVSLRLVSDLWDIT